MDELRSVIDAFVADDHHTASSTPPSAWYTDSRVYTLEREAVFSRRWWPIARVGQLEGVGAYVAACIAGEPLFVIRGEDGALRGYHNVCRHKATPLVGGVGRVERLVCPYHGWVYQLDGRLKRAPQLGRVQGFDREAHSLKPVQVEVWGPYVFVNADPEAGPLVDGLGPLPAALAASGWTELRYHATQTWDVDCNWKVFCDNYLDGGYHVSQLHPSLAAQLDLSSYRTEVFDRCVLQTTGAAAGVDARTSVDPARRIGDGAIYAFLYPAFMINRYGPAMDTNLVVPLGPERCRVVFDYFFEDGVDAQFIEGSMAQAAITQREDVEVSAAVQVGLGSRAYDRGRYAEIEVGVHHFHRLLSADLRSAFTP